MKPKKKPEIIADKKFVASQVLSTQYLMKGNPSQSQINFIKESRNNTANIIKSINYYPNDKSSSWITPQKRQKAIDAFNKKPSPWTRLIRAIKGLLQ